VGTVIWDQLAALSVAGSYYQVCLIGSWGRRLAAGSDDTQWRAVTSFYWSVTCLLRRKIRLKSTVGWFIMREKILYHS
jgi:hypothetical protein